MILFYFWLCWVFVSVRGLPLVVASGGHSSSRCAGLSLSRPLSLRSTGSRRAGSVVVAHGPSCSAAYGILPDQGSNPCPLHWQADSQPLRHQGSPHPFLSWSSVMVCQFQVLSPIFPAWLPQVLVPRVLGCCGLGQSEHLPCSVGWARTWAWELWILLLSFPSNNCVIFRQVTSSLRAPAALCTEHSPCLPPGSVLCGYAWEIV